MRNQGTREGSRRTNKTNRATIERFWEALRRQDFQAAAAELHDDFVEDYPQSGERVGRDDLWVTEAEFDYTKDGGPPWQVCEIQEVREGKIWRIHGSFGAPFEPAGRRSRFMEQI